MRCLKLLQTMIKKSILIIFIFCCFLAKAQKGNMNFGLQYKPIIASAYFDAGTLNLQEEAFTFNLSPKYGSSLGMIVRYNLSNTFSIETGMNLVQRNYQLDISNTDQNIEDFTNIEVRSYELPLQFLSYAKISPRVYLNASFGLSYNIFTSDQYSSGNNNEFFGQFTAIRKRGQSALIANFGGEYRTEEKGYYYLGFSFHRPFDVIARIYAKYDDGDNVYNENAPSSNSSYMELNGNFLTIDLRYFFP
jgi:hypothetical protein